MSNARKLTITSTKEVKLAMRNCPPAHHNAEHYGVLSARFKDVVGELQRMAETEGRNFDGYCFEPVYVSCRDQGNPRRLLEFGESHQTDDDIFIWQAMWE